MALHFPTTLASLGLFLVGACLFSLPLAKFLNDAWLTDKQQRQVRDKFTGWWVTVVDFDRLKLALAVADKVNSFTDRLFGPRLFSKRVFFRAMFIATALLVCSLAMVGVTNHKLFGIEPWSEYQQTATQIRQLAAAYKNMPLPGLGTNAAQNGMNVTSRVAAAGSGISTTATNSTQSTTNSLQKTPNEQLAENHKQLRHELDDLVATVNRLDRPILSAVYSVIFLTVLVFLNGLLFYTALTFSRIILREIIAAARPFSIAGLITMDFMFVIIVATAFLLLLTILATPLVWYFMPVVYHLSKASFEWLGMFFIAGGVLAWILPNAALKVVTLIALLPCIFTLAVMLLTGVAVTARRHLHGFASAVLLRCAEKGVVPVIIATLTLISSAIAIITKLMS